MKNVNEIFDLKTKPVSLFPTTVWDRPFNAFTCEYCGQHFSKEFCKISTFLYGVIFLFGKETGHIGFTCANCKKTLLFQGTETDIRTLHTEMISDYYSFNGALGLSYFSSVNYYPSQIPSLKNFDIKCSDSYVKNTWPWMADDSYFYPDRSSGGHYEHIDNPPDIKQNYLCSNQTPTNSHPYFFIGDVATLWWFKEEDIIKLCDLENSKDLRIFPRYVSLQYTDFEAIENYFWKHKLYLDFLNSNLKITKFWDKEIDGPEHQTTYAPNPDGEDEIPMAIDMDERIPMWSIEKDIIVEEKRKKYDLSQTSELAQILIAPKRYWKSILNVDIQPSIEYWLNAIDLFKSNTHTLPITGFMPDDVARWKKEQIEFHEITRKVRQNFHEKFVQDFLLENHEPFISTYTKLAQSKNFTYANIWQLKEDLLYRLYSHILVNERGTHAESNYLPVQNTNTNLSDNFQEDPELEKEIEEYKSKISAFKDIISCDPKIYEILRDIKVFASDTLNMQFLIQGETGTGKELFAKAIHAASPCHSDRERVCVNCGAIAPKLFESLIFGLRKSAGVPIEKDTPGKLEQANNSTIFFDEVGDFPLEQQPKLFRTLQEGEIEPVGGKTTKINTTFIFATNKNLVEKVEKGEFREELYNRINTFVYTIPPLRERKTDIPLLLKHFIEKNSKELNIEKLSVPEECINYLCQYNWPGNVRELENKIEKIMKRRKGYKDYSELRSTEFELPPTVYESITESNNSLCPLENIKIKPADGKRKMPEKQIVEQVLKEVYAQEGRKYGVIAKAAEHIGVSQGHLNREISKLDIKWEN